MEEDFHPRYLYAEGKRPEERYGYKEKNQTGGRYSESR